MRRTTLIIPGLLREGVLRNLPNLSQLRDGARVGRVGVLPAPTPEAQWLGLRPEEGQLAQGPLTLSALGVDPPERSTHFHISPLAIQGPKASIVGFALSDLDLRALWPVIERLNTRNLTLVQGFDRDHGLVWENTGALWTTPPTGGIAWATSLPEGDAEAMLRRFIDDSANLLGELEWNRQRAGEGLPTIDMLWPWGHGVRLRLPNLALRRGRPATVLSGSLRLQGLARLVGYQAPPWHRLRTGLPTDFEALGSSLSSLELALAVLIGVESLGPDELDWWAREFDRRFVPALMSQLESPDRSVVLLALEGDSGVALWRGRGVESNSWPFDERTLEERTAPRLLLNEWIAAALS